MRRLSILIVVLFTLSFAAMPLLAEEHACTKSEKSCCQKNAACCKDANAACCKEAKSCCVDSECCKTAADGTHTCTMKHTDGSACTSMSCCKNKGCDVKKTS